MGVLTRIQNVEILKRVDADLRYVGTALG
jgi:hypothetical protein